MTHKTHILPLVIIVVAMMVAALLIISRPQAEKAVLDKKPLLVNVEEIRKKAFQITVKAQGLVSPRTETTLISEVSGKVIDVSTAFLAGGIFKKGDILLQIDDRNYQTQLKRAEAQVARARSELAQEKGRGFVAQQDWKKRGDRGKVSLETKALALREPQLTDAQAMLDSALADLQSAKDDLARTAIKAPYNGVLRKKLVDIGQFVNAGTPLGVSFDVDRAEIRLAIPESKLPYLQLPEVFNNERNNLPTPLPAVLLSNRIDDQERQWQALLTRTETVLDERSRVLFVVAQIDDPYGIKNKKSNRDFTPLRIGSFVEAEIEGRLIDGLVKLPRQLLRAGNKLWVVDDDNRLQERVVRILRAGDTSMYVKEGLSDGERICLTSVGAVLPGTKVRIAEPQHSKPAADIHREPAL